MRKYLISLFLLGLTTAGWSNVPYSQTTYNTSKGTATTVLAGDLLVYQSTTASPGSPVAQLLGTGKGVLALGGATITSGTLLVRSTSSSSNFDLVAVFEDPNGDVTNSINGVGSMLIGGAANSLYNNGGENLVIADNSDGIIRLNRANTNRTARVAFWTSTTENWRMGEVTGGNSDWELQNQGSSPAAAIHVALSSSFVGMGTSTPQAALQLSRNGPGTVLGQVSHSLLALTDTQGLVGNLTQIDFGYGGALTYAPAAIAGLVNSQSANTSSHLVFATRLLTTDSPPLERMRITDSGLVGVATSSPQTTLDVNGSFQSGSGATKSTFSASGFLALDKAAVLTTGGATPANGTLIVQSTSSTNGAIALDLRTSGGTREFSITSIGTTYIGERAFADKDFAGSGENVLIADNSDGILRLNRNTNARNAFITLWTNTTRDWVIGENPVSTESDFSIFNNNTGGRPLTLLKASNNVGIFNTNPQATLDVTGTGSFSSVLNVGGPSNPSGTLVVRSTASTNTDKVFVVQAPGGTPTFAVTGIGNTLIGEDAIGLYGGNGEGIVLSVNTDAILRMNRKTVNRNGSVDFYTGNSFDWRFGNTSVDSEMLLVNEFTGTNILKFGHTVDTVTIAGSVTITPATGIATLSVKSADNAAVVETRGGGTGDTSKHDYYSGGVLRFSEGTNVSANTSATKYEITQGASFNRVITINSANNNNLGIQNFNPQTTLDVGGDAQFGTGATKSTFTATGNLLVPGQITAGSGIQGSSGTFSGQVQASSFNIVGTAYLVNGVTVIDGSRNVISGSSITTSGGFFGNGSGITGVTAGSVSAANVSAGTFASGVLLPAGSLTNGPVASSILPSTVAYTSVSNTFSAAAGNSFTYGVSVGSLTIPNVVITSTRVVFGDNIFLGIGTPTPNQKLDVEGGNAGIYIGNTNGQAGFSQLFLADVNGSNNGAEIYYQGSGQGLNGNANSLVLETFTSTGSVTIRTNSADRIVVNGTGQVLIDTNSIDSSINNFSGNPYVFLDQNGDSNSGLVLSEYSADANGSEVDVYKTRGAASTPNVSLINGDTVGLTAWLGSNGSAYKNGARLTVSVEGNPTASAVPMKFTFRTVDNSGASHNSIITSSGDFIAAGNLQVVGPSLTVGVSSFVVVGGQSVSMVGQLIVKSSSTAERDGDILQQWQDDGGNTFGWLNRAGGRGTGFVSNQGYAPLSVDITGSSLGWPQFFPIGSASINTHFLAGQTGNVSNGGRFACAKNRAGLGGGMSAASGISVGDTICDFEGWPADGAQYDRTTRMRFSNEVGTTLGGGGVVSFWTAANGDGNVTERMRVNSTGLVGINTTAPDSQLHVVGPSSLTVPGARITSSDNTLSVTHANTNYRSALGFHGGTGVPFLALHAEHSLVSANTFANDGTTSFGFAMYHDQGGGAPCIVHAWNGTSTASADFSGTVNTLKVCQDGGLKVNGSTLTVTSGGIVSAPSQPGITLYFSGAATQNLKTASTTPVYWGTADAQQNIKWSVTADSSTVTIPTGAGGLYHISASFRFPASTATFDFLRISVNGTVQLNCLGSGSATVETDISCANRRITLAAGDTIQANMFQNSGVDMSVCAQQGTCYMSIQKGL